MKTAQSTSVHYAYYNLKNIFYKQSDYWKLFNSNFIVFRQKEKKLATFLLWKIRLLCL